MGVLNVMTQPFRSHRFMFPFVLVALALLLTPASRAVAHEEGDSAITLRAPLDAADCAATPPTITVLGLAIDVSTATFGGGGDGEHDDDEDGGGTPPSCTDLVVGQRVVVTLAS